MKIKCHICGSDTAQVRQCEIEKALITGRAHVDCGGHAQYRPLTSAEVKQINADLEIDDLSHHDGWDDPLEEVR